jgi:RNA polymerase sigma factor for flagellar operon FliA
VPLAPDRQSLVLEAQPIAGSLARRYQRELPPGIVSRDDLEQQAMLGVVQAAQRWDPAREAGWPSFAYRRALGAIQDLLRALSPGHRDHWREFRVTHLEQPVAHADGVTLGETIPAPERPLDDLPDPRLAEAIEQAIGEELTLDEQSALAMRVDSELSLREIGEAMGVSESRACQFVARGFDKLRERRLELAEMAGL